MDHITLSAPAKINLYLEVTGLRADGYHNVDNVMHTCPLHDIIHVALIAGKDITLHCTGASLPEDHRNLAYRAAELFLKHTGLAGQRAGVSITIEKHIPVAAGLAGGSTDAAAVLKALNELYDTHLPLKTLCDLGAQLGADVPFCILGGAALASGIGTEMIPLPPMPPCRIEIVPGRIPVSTPQAFAALDRLTAKTGREIRTGGGKAIADALQTGDLRMICSCLYNAFELVNPEAEAVKQRLIRRGAIGALLSGSGPTVYGIFPL